jgi:GNAT superfamily N-acetyltransferase
MVREAGLEDAALLGRLIDAMDVHYNGAGNTSGADQAADCALQALQSGEGSRFLVAEVSGRPAGIACFAVIRPGRRLAGLVFLKDLFVEPDYRSRGVGRELMRALARYALERDIGRIDLTTDVTNSGAQKLYEELGGARQAILRYSFDTETMRKLCHD